MYTNPKEIHYYSKRYRKYITVPKGYKSDGATGVLDVCPKSWYVHDWMCGNYLGEGPKPIGGQFDDGTKINNWQCSHIFADILREEGYIILPYTRFWGTWFLGGGKCRENGLW